MAHAAAPYADYGDQQLQQTIHPAFQFEQQTLRSPAAARAGQTAITTPSQQQQQAVAPHQAGRPQQQQCQAHLRQREAMQPAAGTTVLFIARYRHYELGQIEPDEGIFTKVFLGAESVEQGVLRALGEDLRFLGRTITVSYFVPNRPTEPRLTTKVRSLTGPVHTVEAQIYQAILVQERNGMG